MMAQTRSRRDETWIAVVRGEARTRPAIIFNLENRGEKSGRMSDVR